MSRGRPGEQRSAGGGAGGDDGVRAAISALSEDEPRVAHAVRLAAVITSPDTDRAERLELLRRVLTLDPRVARQVALDIADDEDEGVRVVACGVLASTIGSEDDLPRLLSLAADDRLSGQHEALQIATEAVRNPDPVESVALLLRLVDVPPEGLDTSIDALVPAVMHQAQLVRWINKAWSRAADHRQPQRFLDAARVLGGIAVDQTLLGCAAQGLELGLTASEIDQITHGLRDRPTALQLADRPEVRSRYPWIDAYAELAAVGGSGFAGRSPQMSVLGARDIASGTASLKLLVRGWLVAMQPRF